MLKTQHFHICEKKKKKKKERKEKANQVVIGKGQIVIVQNFENFWK